MYTLYYIVSVGSNIWWIAGLVLLIAVIVVLLVLLVRGLFSTWYKTHKENLRSKTIIEAKSIAMQPNPAYTEDDEPIDKP